MTLPKKLNIVPIIDSAFEIRFSSKAPASVIIPGYLFEKLTGENGEKTIEQLPIMQMPKVLRDSDPSLRFAPECRINWGRYAVAIGSSSIIIGCNNPYAGWNNFKAAILQVLERLSELNLVESVLRYSIKFTDILSATDLRQQVSMVNIEMNIAGHKLEKEAYRIRVEIPKDGFINVIQLTSSAKATLHDKTVKSGLVIEVDTITTEPPITLADLNNQFQERADTIHHTNKVLFFDCLTSETLNSLGPEYE